MAWGMIHRARKESATAWKHATQHKKNPPKTKNKKKKKKRREKEQRQELRGNAHY